LDCGAPVGTIIANVPSVLFAGLLVIRAAEFDTERRCGSSKTFGVPSRFGNWRPELHVRHDERADRAVINSATETHMAMVVLTWLHLFTLEQVASRDIEPAGNRFHQLVTDDWEAIDIAAAGKRIPRMRQRRDGGDQHCNDK
jgi:hypothetical protein